MPCSAAYRRAPRNWTFRDAGLHALPWPARALVRLGALAPRRPSLAPDALLEAAEKRTGLDDFGDDAFR